MQTVRIAWVAAEIQAAGHQWHAPRELALATGRWSVQVNTERGGKGRRLPDLVFWPTPSGLPVAVVVEHGAPNPRREQAALEGWKASITAGQYAQVRYVTDPSSARRLEDGAARAGLTGTQLVAGERVVTDEPLVLALPVETPAEPPLIAEATLVAVPDPPRVTVRPPGPSTTEAVAITREQPADRDAHREPARSRETPRPRRWGRWSA